MEAFAGPVPLWLFLVAILIAASLLTGIVLAPRLLSLRPDFQVQPGLTSETILAEGCCIPILTVAVTSLNGFTGIVSMRATPSGNLNATVEGGPVDFLGTGTDLIAIMVWTSIPGNYTVIITGTSRELSHSNTVAIIAQDFTVNASPDPLIVTNYSTGNSTTITIAAVNGFYGNLTDLIVFHTFPSCFNIDPLRFDPGSFNVVLPRSGSVSVKIAVTSYPQNYQNCSLSFTAYVTVQSAIPYSNTKAAFTVITR